MPIEPRRPAPRDPATGRVAAGGRWSAGEGGAVNGRPGTDGAGGDGPRISVIVLNFNGEKIVGKCLDHLLAQSYPDFEIIVVDNGSSDGSLALLEPYLQSGRLSVIANRHNLGVPGGRNLGLRHAQGEIIAFIDNDGYADRNWLKEGVGTFEADPRIGAVASVVFFASRKLILNGAGGTVNRQGYGGDLCFNTAYEFAELPSQALYPMGCGMLVRRSAMERAGPFDELPIKWYEDVELGIRLWKLGYRVAVAPNAWVDHDMGHSDQYLPDRNYMCERARIRNALKYFPARRLPEWLAREGGMLSRHRSPGHCMVLAKAWAWNLAHLPSVLRWRAKFSFKPKAFWDLLDPSWGEFPPPVPNNGRYRPDPARASERLVLDGADDEHRLNFGWYWAEREGSLGYRWTHEQASAFFSFRSPVRTCSIALRAPNCAQSIGVVIRRLGEIEPALRTALSCRTTSWGTKRLRCELGPGLYEMLLLTPAAFKDELGRRLGLAVSAIEFA